MHLPLAQRTRTAAILAAVFLLAAVGRTLVTSAAEDPRGEVAGIFSSRPSSVHVVAPGVARTAERLQRRLIRTYNLSVSLHTLERAIEEQRRLMRLTVTVTVAASDGHAFVPWVVTLHRYPSWMRARLTRDFRFEMDREVMAAFLKAYPPEEIPLPTDAVVTRLTDDAGVLRAEIFGTAVPGYRLDPDDTAEVLAHAYSADISQVVIGARPEDGKIINQTGMELGSLELLAEGRSNFAGSGLGRKANVRRGLDEFLGGVVVPPGATFSFNAAVHNMKDSGWQMAMGIFEGEELRLVPGGGICQVATTVYRSALLAGLPIERRAPHSLYVSYYEQYGVGIDAAVFPGRQDLVFRNDTPGHLLIQAAWQGEDAYVRLYGTTDGRSATLMGPYFRTNAPADLLVNGRALRGNEIAWLQDVRRPDGTVTRTVVLSGYRGMPASLARKYATP